MSECYLSICIPSYNRPEELMRLLRSIDASEHEKIEIVITEDMAPKRNEVRAAVREYAASVPYIVNYQENPDNRGYDKNIRLTAKAASGRWIMYMGDDDVFVPGSLDRFLDFLERHEELGYILRRYQKTDEAGKTEEFRYDTKDVLFSAGEDAVIELFRRSVFLSGFTFRKSCFQDYDCADYDGTLLFQLYIQSVICLHYPAAYCDVPITRWMEGCVPYFGAAETEKELYHSGAKTFDNSINFMKQVRRLTESFDKKNGTHVTEPVIRTYSKYSYGFLYEHSDEGRTVFREYAKELKKLGFACTPHFYLYYWMLWLLGKKNSHKMIVLAKRMLGRTPKL